MRAYQLEDYAEVSSWFIRQGAATPTQEELPRVGLIVPGVAVGFLYQTDSCVALLENFATNPAVWSERRHEALLNIAEELIKVAQELGFKKVFAITKHPSVSKRAQLHHGFESGGEFEILARGI